MLYALLDGDVVFRTAPGEKLLAAALSRTVVFEIDAFDVDARQGWSVDVVGEAEETAKPGERAPAQALGLEPWAGEARLIGTCASAARHVTGGIEHTPNGGAGRAVQVPTRSASLPPPKACAGIRIARRGGRTAAPTARGAGRRGTARSRADGRCVPMRSRSRSSSSSAARFARRLEVAGVVEEHAGLAGNDLVDDAADCGADDGARLPHRLGDGEPEALGETLLHDDRRVALQRIDDRRRLRRGRPSVCRRGGRGVALRSGSRFQSARHSSQDLIRLGVVGDAARLRARRGSDGRRCRSTTCSANPLITPLMSFIASQRDACSTTGTSGGGGGPVPRRSTCRVTRPCEPSRRVNSRIGSSPLAAEQPDVAGVSRTTSASSIGSFLAENGSIEGAMTARSSRGTHGRRELLAREDVAVDRVDVGAEELPAALGVLVRRVDADMAAPDDACARAPHGRGQPGGLRVVQHDDVAGPDDVEQLVDVALAGSPRSRRRSARRAGRRRPRVPYRWLWRRFVISKNRGLPSITTQRASTPDATRVREQRLQHLGNAAARRGRVHVQDRAPVEERPAAAPPSTRTARRVRHQSAPRADRGGALGRRPPVSAISISTPAFGTHYESPIDIMLAEGTLRTDDDADRVPHSIPMPGTHPAHRATQRYASMWNAHSASPGEGAGR